MSISGSARDQSVASRSGRAYSPAIPESVPCAATASLFLFAQGRNILCVHHDTLALERRFEKHDEEITFISADNVSEQGAGRLVVSCDTSKNTIVWDLFSGDEIARFVAYQPLRTAAWMRNGHVVLGNDEGEIIDFEPSSSKYTSVNTIIDPITVIAPSADCQSYAVGYLNGTVLLVSLAPTFNILHTISASRRPSPMVGLAWHTSSSKQKSDMLATQCQDGELRVWSVSKPPALETPKVIRELKRGEAQDSGLCWMAWSKNGRIIQYRQGETWAWDVRTKHVAYEPVPTMDDLKGLANYGPSATLFTIGPDHLVEQYDLNPPALIKSHRFGGGVRAPPIQNVEPPRSNSRQGVSAPAPIKLSQPQNHERSGSREERRPQIDTNPNNQYTDRAESVSSMMSLGQSQYRAPSVASSRRSGTVFSTDKTVDMRIDTQSPYRPAAPASVASSTRRARAPSRLKNEIIRSPETQMIDLFPITRKRLAGLSHDMTKESPEPVSASPDEKRRHMLRILFGWMGDIEDLIRDEMDNHPAGSTSATLLAKWLGEYTPDVMAMMQSGAAIGSNDWMLFALSQVNGTSEQAQQMGRGFASRLEQQGDIHTAATVLIGIDDFEGAVAIYTTRNIFMEATLLTSLLFADEWDKQADMVRKWGEFVVENSQQSLAMRCFSCVGAPKTLPGWAPLQMASPNQNLPPGLRLASPISPHGNNTTSRVLSASLKVITSFPEKKASTFKFPGLKAEDATPTVQPGITPIAESAVSPGGTPIAPKRTQRGRRRFGSEASRLSSVLETPTDVTGSDRLKLRQQSETPFNDSGSENESASRKGSVSELTGEIEQPPLTLSSMRYDPNEDAKSQVSHASQNSYHSKLSVASGVSKTSGQTPQTAVQRTGSSNMFERRRAESKTRGEHRESPPAGLSITAPPLSQVNLRAIAVGPDGITPLTDHYRQSVTNSSIHSSIGTGRSFGDFGSPLITGESASVSIRSPQQTGRSIDRYISSLEQANYYSRQQKEASVRQRSRSGGRLRQRSPDRLIRVPPARVSPTSPVAMSPEELQRYRNMNNQSLDSTATTETYSSIATPDTHDPIPMHIPHSRVRGTSKVSEFSNRTERQIYHRRPSDAGINIRSRSTQRSPDSVSRISERRGRSVGRIPGPQVRSPSSSHPNSPPADHTKDDQFKIVEANRERLRSRQRSTSRAAGAARVRNEAIEQVQQVRRGSQSSTGHRPHLSDGRSDVRAPTSERRSSDGDSDPTSKYPDGDAARRARAAADLAARRMSLLDKSQHADIYVSHPSRPGMGDRAVTDLGPSSHSPTPTYDLRDMNLSPGGQSSVETSQAVHQQANRRDNRFDAELPNLPAAPQQYYATGQPMMELPRSVSVPILQSQTSPPSRSIARHTDSHLAGSRDESALIANLRGDTSVSNSGPPSDMPLHPAFSRNVRPSQQSGAARRAPQFAPLSEIGQPRRPSVATIDQSLLPSTSYAPTNEDKAGLIMSKHSSVIDVPELSSMAYTQTTTVVPALAHLGETLPPPPPPPIGNMSGNNTSFASSGSGTIDIVMEEHDGQSVPVVSLTPQPQAQKYHPAPPIPQEQPVASTSAFVPGHNRGRSTDTSVSASSRFVGRLAGRMRSSSRGRLALATPEEKMTKRDDYMAPYESIKTRVVQATPDEKIVKVREEYVAPYESVKDVARS